MNIRSKVITKSITASIVATHSKSDLDGSLWAINWFDVKSKWLYDLYNLIAKNHVVAVGGVPLFKASRIETILGVKEDERKMILIVKYPRAKAFLEMVSSKMFQLKSMLRKYTVREFTIGFMYASDDNLKPKSKEERGSRNLVYLVHHFSGRIDDDILSGIRKLAIESDIFLQFAGRKEALVGMSENGGKLTTIPFIMDNLLIFGAFEKSQFDDMIALDLYQELINQNGSNYIGIFKREF